MTLTIRKGKRSDIDEIISVIRNIGWHRTESTKESLIVHFNQVFDSYESDDHDIYVAVKSKKVVGYIVVHWFPYLIFEGNEGHISEIFINPAWSNQGIGSVLIDTIKSEAIKKRCYRLSLVNRKTRESYLRKFYQKNGFIEREHMASFVLTL
ncbi:MAG: GNAT family N-acetyltransferase [Candidatus Kariarchaeaceae archaeon]|jgi:GNAT superfamily N-acetyltransferase